MKSRYLACWFILFIARALPAQSDTALISKPPKDAPSDTGYEVLYNFGGTFTDGTQPQAGLISDGAGNLYGTTTDGGTGNNGTVFKVDLTGQETVLYSFCPGSSCDDGAAPEAGVIRDAEGNLYGTTASGGANGSGTVFKLDSLGNETVLYSFCSAPNCADGLGAYAGLIQDSTGNLYGTTVFGGANGHGTLFKVDSSGHETVLYNFCSASNCEDGATPEAALTQDADGNLYGTTESGGSPAFDCGSGSGCGTVFKLDSTGHESVLYSFCSVSNCDDGFAPTSVLVRDAAGSLYGTTLAGDLNVTGGTVFKLDATGHLTVLYSFCSENGCTDGNSATGVIQDAQGNLYGTTRGGGTGAGGNGAGTVFKIDKKKHETVLYNFCSEGGSFCTDGELPEAGLIEIGGEFYGTASQGGENNSGVVFKLATGAVGKASATLTSSPNPSYVNESVTFSAVVSGAGATPTGTVTFQEGKSSLGTVTLTSGEASLTTGFAKARNFSIVANYSGDQNYGPAKSKPLKQTVQKYPTSTSINSSPNPSEKGQPVALAATVSSGEPGGATGVVMFKNGSTSLGKATLSGGMATLTTTRLPEGTLTLTADYKGDAESGQSSGTTQQVVNP